MCTGTTTTYQKLLNVLIVFVFFFPFFFWANLFPYSIVFGLNFIFETYSTRVKLVISATTKYFGVKVPLHPKTIIS